ncbi:MAG: hypothetical protein N3F62_00425 [Bacteroidia bacterium]|nr:hypothetical protein [Bacteroidia bacterium]
MFNFFVNRNRNGLCEINEYYILNSYHEEDGGKFQNVLCKIIDRVKYKNRTFYLINTDINFSGIDFGHKAIPINEFFVEIRTPFISDSRKFDVIIYLQMDENDTFNNNNPKIVGWGYLEKVN